MLETLLEELQGKNKHKKIIYPDVRDTRILEAVTLLKSLGENPVICGKKSELSMYSDFILGGGAYFEVPDDQENIIFAAKTLAQGDVDGFIGGNISRSSDIVRALIKNIGSKEGISRISSHFLFGRKQEVFLYSDGGIQIDPNIEQIAEIGSLSIESAERYGMKPRVALLSFSTAGSGGDHPKVVKMRQATELLRHGMENKDIPIEGEIQFDAAYIPEIGQRKNPTTELKTSANVFIFPDLDSANIAYKITERLGGAIALGPIIQGLAKPANDLSRGCSVEDIIAMHHITKNQ